MTSSSSLGTTSITLQFDLSRDIDFAARCAGRNQCRADVPAGQPSRQSTYRKVNPADAPARDLGTSKIRAPSCTTRLPPSFSRSFAMRRGTGERGRGTLPSCAWKSILATQQHGLTLQHPVHAQPASTTGQISDDHSAANIITKPAFSRGQARPW